ncbi:GH92 family glycosyl hydrolase [Lederbergia ruris]|uniref:GH92 family glycosyl hydrolase n=1 Tax=Lederbergia ruris TaxID=217495 RepID=UPI00399FEEA5
MEKRQVMKLFTVVICVALLVVVIYIPPVQTASAAPIDFFTSFEDGDPQPDWENTVETDAKGNKMAEGIDGNVAFDGIQGDITDRVVKVTASANNPPNETEQQLIDRDVSTKWLGRERTAWIELQFSEPEKVIKYAFTSANDAPGRDPKDWKLSGSNDGKEWTTLDTRTNESFKDRFQTKIYEFENGNEYVYYRLDITKNAGDSLTQLAEIQLSNGIDVPPPPPADMKSFISKGPSSAYTAKTNVGWRGLKAFTYSGTHLTEGRAYSYNKIFDVDIPVTANSELSYYILPEFGKDHLDYSGTYAAIDLAFSDGTYLHELDAVDHHGIKLNPQDQGQSNTLYPNQWNFKKSKIGDVAAGKTIKRILIAYDNPEGPGIVKGTIDDIKIEANPVEKTYDRLSEYVNTLRGTQSNGTFSRGNNFPAVAVPHGFNFWTPVTNAGSNWIYAYHESNNKDNLPEIQAFALSHETSPWMGDRQTFQVMPSDASGKPSANRNTRALPFKHDNETARAHYYGVTFENGIQTEMTPTDHGAIMRFTFKDDSSNLIFDNVSNSGGITLDPDNGTISGYTDQKSGLSTGATRMFVYATFDQPVVDSGKLTGEGRDNVTAYYKFDTTKEKVVTMKMGTSLISVDQAKKNLDQEIGPKDTFETIKEKAQLAWDDKLGIIEVEGATEDQLTTLYSNMYRLFLYPNSAYENVGTVDAPVYKYASQLEINPCTTSTATETCAKIEDGKVYVNNGFWDTYRTAWPAYALLTPTRTGEMIDGFVQHYRDGGWISRWSSPGYANLMVGTSANIAFSDAYLKGVTNFDVEGFYQSALKDAAVVPPNANVGRKGMATSVFDGYTNTSTGEGLSWALDGYINDFGIANLANALAKKEDKTDPYHSYYEEDYKYYLNRAQNYVNMFNPNVGFFMGRTASGNWRSAPENFNPATWWGDYTETNAWNMAFHAPQDGQGLANLYGGKDGLAKKIDELFNTPETSNGGIHEEREAKDLRMGMYGHSNQPAHHIIYMYNYAGQPWKTQEKVREVLNRLYIGSEIGQGYAGDEDNGEMSAWYIFSALGFYPLKMGTPEYAIGAPLFKKATIHLENGKDIVINAPNNSRDNKYIQGLKLNGKSYTKNYIAHADLASGATLDFDMGSKPSKWGSNLTDLPKSIDPAVTDGISAPQPLKDLTDQGAGKASDSENSNTKLLFDNTSDTRWSVNSDHPWIQYEFTGGKQQATMYTLTSGADSQAADPTSWVLKGSNDGESWTVLDERKNEGFKWRRYTRAFAIQNPGSYSIYQLEISGNGGHSTTSLSEVELLGFSGEMIGSLSAGMQSLVERFEKEDEFKNESAARALKLHLIAVERFEQQGVADKVLKHMNGFKALLDHQQDSALISKEAYQILYDSTDYFIERWQHGGVVAFKASDLNFDNIKPGEDVDISAVVKNVGVSAGEEKVVFYFDGELVETKTLTLKPGENKTVTFTIKNVTAGSHEVRINNLSGMLLALHDHAPMLSLQFDQDSGTNVKDSSPYGFAGTIKDKATWEKGKFGNALNLDNGWVEVPHDVLLNGGDELTLSLWVNLSNPNANQKIIGKYGKADGYILGVENGQFYPEVWDANGKHYTFKSGFIPKDEWTHLALTWKSNGRLIGYVNGEEVENIEVSAPMGINESPLLIGRAPWSSVEYKMKGMVDELRIYNRALSTKEIQQLYQKNEVD